MKSAPHLSTHRWQVSYNGFSWVERCAVIPIQNAAIRSGQLIRPTVCCICGDGRTDRPQGRDYRFLHLEDYRKPLQPYGCCKGCHAALHARFRNPERWQDVLDRHARPGEWFTMLSLDPASQWKPFDLSFARPLPPPSLTPQANLLA